MVNGVNYFTLKTAKYPSKKSVKICVAEGIFVISVPIFYSTISNVLGNAISFA